MTNLETEIYTLMDQFLTDGDKPRSLENLNKDRRLFVDNLKFSITTWALECVGEDDHLYGLENGFELFRNNLRAEIRQRMRESLGDDPLAGLVIKPSRAKDRRLMKKAKGEKNE